MFELPGSSPLSFGGGLAAQPQQYQQSQPARQMSIQEQSQPDETNAERTYRDAANFCEVVAPAALGSAVVFAFHSMQVAGGSVFAIGLYQVYLAAKISGQSSRRLTTAIVGLGVTASMIACLAEPIGEWQQASTTKSRVTTEVKEIRTVGKVRPNLHLNYLPPIALAIIVFGLIIKLKGGRK
jgi:hypothetical protein